MARLAEQAERFEDMVEYMKRVARMGSALSEEERNLLSMAYKNWVGQLRSACRQIDAMVKTEYSDSPYLADIQIYHEKISEKRKESCVECLGLLEEILKIPEPESPASFESQVFYLKMKGDYYRYLAEHGEGASSYRDYAAASYQEASNVAAQHLDSTNPIRLGLALNFSVFYYEVCQNRDQACLLADTALKEAQMTGAPSEATDQSRSIVQLLRDNLQLWRGGHSQGDGTAVEDF